MPRVIRTAQAREDVLDIWLFVAADNVTAADHLIVRLDGVVRLLAEQPRLGSPQDKFRVGLRCIAVERYLIFYEPLNDGICVLRILHSARHWIDLIP